jgi:hypothetical protein
MMQNRAPVVVFGVQTDPVALECREKFDPYLAGPCGCEMGKVASVVREQI